MRAKTAENAEPVVRLVDDDPSLLRALTLVLRAAGFRVVTYDSAESFLVDRSDAPGCAVIDLHMAGRGGLELQGAIQEMPHPLPVIFLTGRGDVKSSVSAMKGGAVDFLTKPATSEALLEAVVKAIAIDGAARRERNERSDLRARYQTLTARERDVLRLVARGLLNKQIAAELGAAERTIKAHRANVMRKMRLSSVADLTRAADRLGVDSPVV